jgi:hypothetical protein
MAESGIEGQFQFEGLPPGTYLLISSMELNEFNEQALRQAGAKEVAVGAGARPSLQLDLHMER